MINFKDFLIESEVKEIYARELQQDPQLSLQAVDESLDDEYTLAEAMYKKKPKVVAAPTVTVKMKEKPKEKEVPCYTGTEFTEFKMPEKTRDMEFATVVWEYYMGKPPSTSLRVNVIKIGKWTFDHSVHALSHYYLRHKPILTLPEYKLYLTQIEKWLSANVKGTDETKARAADDYPEQQMERVIFVRRFQGKSYGMGIICENFNKSKVLRIITYLPKNKHRDKDGHPPIMVEAHQELINNTKIVIIDMD